jgi:hypothetical protein
LPNPNYPHTQIDPCPIKPFLNFKKNQTGRPYSAPCGGPQEFCYHSLQSVLSVYITTRHYMARAIPEGAILQRPQFRRLPQNSIASALMQEVFLKKMRESGSIPSHRTDEAYIAPYPLDPMGSLIRIGKMPLRVGALRRSCPPRHITGNPGPRSLVALRIPESRSAGRPRTRYFAHEIVSEYSVAALQGSSPPGFRKK